MPPQYGKKIVIFLYEIRKCPGKTGQLVILSYVLHTELSENLSVLNGNLVLDKNTKYR